MHKLLSDICINMKGIIGTFMQKKSNRFMRLITFVLKQISKSAS